ncbi:esterase/lipase family protein [Rhodococcus qingshengii]
MSPTDLVVVIPGIMGSTLAKNGKPFWSNKLGALVGTIFHPNRNASSLRVPEGLGDEHPGDGVTPTGLMGNIHVVPGLWSPVQGYGVLVDRLRKIGFHDTTDGTSEAPNLVLFPYDWRLSNRFNARQLKTVVERALLRWRESSPDNRDARVTFVCHSMGGLIARWYIAAEGGAEVTNKLITFGTPYRGSLKAVATLADGPVPWLAKVGVDLHSAVRSLPSAHQLLPSYACVERDGELHHLEGLEIPGVPSAAVDDAVAFYHRLETAELQTANAPMRHAIIGTKQPTTTSLAIAHGQRVVHNTLNGVDHGGDGTVSAASIPKDVPLDDNTLRRVAEKHGSLQTNRAALDEMEAILTSLPIVFKASDEAEISVAAPEIVMPGEPVTIGISCEHVPQAVVVSVTDELGTTLSRFNRVIRENDQTVVLPALASGGHVIQVRAANNSQALGVSSPVVVWPSE